MTEKTRKIPEYQLFKEATVACSIELVKDAPKSTRKDDLVKWLKKNAEKLLEEYQVDSMEFLIFREPEKKSIVRKTVIDVK